MSDTPTPVSPVPTTPSHDQPRPPVSPVWHLVGRLSDWLGSASVNQPHATRTLRPRLDWFWSLYLAPSALIVVVVGIAMIPISGALMTPRLVRVLRLAGRGWMTIVGVLLVRALPGVQPAMALVIWLLLRRRVQSTRVAVSVMVSALAGGLGLVCIITGMASIPTERSVADGDYLGLMFLVSGGLALQHLGAGLLYRGLLCQEPVVAASSAG